MLIRTRRLWLPTIRGRCSRDSRHRNRVCVFGARRAKRRMGLRGRPLRSFVTTTCIGCVRDIALMQPFDHPAASVDLGSKQTCGATARMASGPPWPLIDPRPRTAAPHGCLPWCCYPEASIRDLHGKLEPSRSLMRDDAACPAATLCASSSFRRSQCRTASPGRAMRRQTRLIGV